MDVRVGKDGVWFAAEHPGAEIQRELAFATALSAGDQIGVRQPVVSMGLEQESEGVWSGK